MNSPHDSSRRAFTKHSLGTAAGVGLWGTSRSWAGANNRVRVAVVGMATAVAP